MLFFIFTIGFLLNIVIIGLIYAYFCVKSLKNDMNYIKENMNKIEKRVFEEEVFRMKHKYED